MNSTISSAQTNINNTTTLSPFFVEPASILQIHITIVSVALLIIVFSYEYSEISVGTLTNYVAFNEFWLVVIGGSVITSLVVYTAPLFFQLNLTFEIITVMWLVLLLSITVIATIALMARIIALTTKDELKVYQSEVSHLAQRLAIIDSRLNEAEGLLNKYSTTISLDVTHASKPTAKITAGELGLSPGERMMDVDLLTMREALDHDGFFLNGYFKLNISQQVSSTDEVILCIVEEVPNGARSKVADNIGESIKTEDFDLFFGFDFFSNDYQVIYDYLEELEQRSISSIDSRNISKLNSCVYSYRSLLYSFNLSTARGSVEPQRRLVQPVLASLATLFEYALKNKPTNEYSIDTHRQSVYARQLYDTVDQTFFMGKDLQEGKFRQATLLAINEQTMSLTYFDDLLRHYNREAEPDHPELADHIQSRIAELNESKPNSRD